MRTYIGLLYPGQPNLSRLAGQPTPKRMGIGTARNWNRVKRLGAMVAAAGP